MDERGRVRPNGYASWEDYFNDRYKGNLLENPYNKKLYDFLSPFWQDFEAASREKRRPQITEETSVLASLDMRILSNVLKQGLQDRLNGFELMPEDLSALHKAQDLVTAHINHPYRRPKEIARMILTKCLHIRSGDTGVMVDRAEEEELKKRARWLLYAGLSGIALSYRLFAYSGLPGIGLLIVSGLFLLSGGLGIRLARRLPDNRYATLHELAKIRWTIALKPKSRSVRRQEQKDRRRRRTSDDGSRVELMRQEGKVRLHGVNFPEAVVKKTFKKRRIFEERQGRVWNREELTTKRLPLKSTKC